MYLNIVIHVSLQVQTPLKIELHAYHMYYKNTETSTRHSSYNENCILEYVSQRRVQHFSLVHKI